MFIGHYALGFAARRVEPRLSLGWALAGPQVLDLVWPLFVLSGVEHVEVAPGATAFTPLAFTYYPWSHSLVMALVWSAAFAGLIRLAGLPLRAALVGGALVASHWVLDFVAHRPDMPLWPGGPRLGLGLWESRPATLVVEIAMYAVGLGLYARATRAKDRTGAVAFWVLAGFLLAVYVANAFGPPPPSSQAIAASALALWLIPPVGAWIERHRTAAQT